MNIIAEDVIVKKFNDKDIDQTSMYVKIMVELTSKVIIKKLIRRTGKEGRKNH